MNQVDETISRRHRRFWDGQFQEYSNQGSRFMNENDDLVSVTLEEDESRENQSHSPDMSTSHNSDSRGGSFKLWGKPFSLARPHHHDDQPEIPATIFTSTSKSSKKHQGILPSDHTTPQRTGMFIRQNVKL